MCFRFPLGGPSLAFIYHIISSPKNHLLYFYWKMHAPLYITTEFISLFSSLSLSHNPFVCMPVCKLRFCPSPLLSVSIYLSACLSASLSVCLSLSLSLCLCLFLSIYPLSSFYFVSFHSCSYFILFFFVSFLFLPSSTRIYFIRFFLSLFSLFRAFTHRHIILYNFI